MAEEILIEESISDRDASELAADCYTDLSKYVIKTRAYASVVDGMKAVYRRTVYASRVYKKRIKSVAIVGDAIKLHPHGDSSITDVLNRMTCKYGSFPLYDGKGNFGGMGSPAAAPRYTEACLSELGRLMYLELIDYAEMIDGEAGFPEPKYLPALLPYCLLVGAGGIPVGMPTSSIPPFNAMDLINYWIGRLEGKDEDDLVLPIPDYGNILINCDRINYTDPLMKTGQGKIWYKGLVIQEDENKFVITESTPKCYIDNVVKKVQDLIDSELIDFIDESDSKGYRYVFIINDMNKVNPVTFKAKLEDIMKCSVTYRLILEEDEKAIYCGIDYIYKKNIKYLRECTVRKFNDIIDKLNSKLLILKAIRDFRDKGYAAKINEMSDEDVIQVIIDLGYERWVGKAVLDKPIRYLNKSHDDEITDLEEECKYNSEFISNPDKYLLTLYYRLREMIQAMYITKEHSVLIDELNDASKLSARLVDKEIIIDDSNEGCKWDRNLILVDKDAVVSKRFISARSSTTIDLSGDENDWKFLLSDKGKYLVLAIDRYLVVKRVSEITNMKQVAKMWEEHEVELAIVAKGEDIEIIDERSNSYKVHLEDYIRSRVSNPIKCAKYKIRKMTDI